MYDVESEQPRDSLCAPVVPLALWLADNWWRIQYEPFPPDGAPVEWRRRHELTSISASIAWPPAMIYGTGGRAVVGPRAGIARVPGPAVYYESPVVSIDRISLETGFDKFFATLESTATKLPDYSALQAVLQQLRDERADDDISSWRRLEAQLGFDPDQAPTELIEKLGRYEERIGEDAVGEAAVASPGLRAAEVLQNALDAARAGTLLNRDAAKVGLLFERSLERAETAWQKAESAAAAVRRRVGMERGPILGTALGDILGVRWDAVRQAPATAGALPYGAVVSDDSDRIAFRSPPYAAPRRFELARALGDAAWDSESSFAPLSRTKTERQKFQRAFAQSFLCPFDEVLELIGAEKPNDTHIEMIARHFHVSELVVRTLLVNKGLLPRAFADVLEAA